MFSALLLLSGVALVAGIPQGRAQDEQLLASPSRNFICKEEDGTYEDPEQCDKYWVCDRGVATPVLCDDGLVFDSLKARGGHRDPCESPYVVDCGNKVKLQEPTYVSDYCPRKNGIFEDPDPAVCTRYHTCFKGVHTTTDCTSGLHFDAEIGLCNYPNVVGRTGCVQKQTSCINNGAFCCTGENVINDLGLSIPHPTFPDLEDCQKFYVCLNGQTPQEGACTLGQVYNEKTTMCDYPDQVPECEGWYKNNPLFDVAYDDADGDGVRDFGVRRDFSQTSIN